MFCSLQRRVSCNIVCCSLYVLLLFGNETEGFNFGILPLNWFIVLRRICAARGVEGGEMHATSLLWCTGCFFWWCCWLDEFTTDCNVMTGTIRWESRLVASENKSIKWVVLQR